MQASTGDVLLRAKLRVPLLPAGPGAWVARPRLLDRLERGSSARLILVSAPPGFGKTGLLAEWVAARGEQSSAAAVWLSLDAADNDPSRFLRYLIAALAPALPGGAEAAAALLESPQTPACSTVMTLLLNALEEAGTGTWLVLDDYHVIEEPQVHECLAFLVDGLPPNAHLLVATRSDPPLPMARWRSRRQLMELRAADLRFTANEAAVFLTTVMGLSLGPESVAALETRTEGWVAGLQMAGLSLQGRDGDETARFVAAFSGTHHFLADYLLEEVLSRQPDQVQEFLLLTAVLSRFTGALCDAVLDWRGPARGGRDTAPSGESSAALLERLARANLFLVPLDDERRWFRYHHLFAELLRARLQSRRPEAIAGLHRRAGAWLAGAGLVAEAMEHFLAVRDDDQAAELIAGHWMELAYRGEVGTVLRWLAALPEDRVYGDARLAVALCWMYLFQGALARLSPAMARATTVLERPDADPESRAHWAALRSNLIRLQGDTGTAITLGEQALALAPVGSVAQAAAYGSLGPAQRDAGLYEAAIRSYLASLPLVRQHGNRLVEAGSVHQVARLLAIQGRLGEAAAICAEMLSAAETRGAAVYPALGPVHVAYADVLRERNELAAARRYLEQGMQLGRRTGQLEPLRAGQLVAARLELAHGDFEQAIAAAREARQAAEGIGAGVLLREARAVEAALLVRAGRVIEAERWVAEITGIESLSEDEGLALSRVLWAAGRSPEAYTRLRASLTAAEAAGRHGCVVSCCALGALIQDREGRSPEAIQLVARALDLAEPEGYVRVFLDEGLPMLALLRRAAARGVHPGYVSLLLRAAGVSTDSRYCPPASGDGPDARREEPVLVELLSEREMEVLRLLAGYLSNNEIAQRLTVSVGTVKTHIHHIYGKLGVADRADAIERALALRLL